MVSLVGLRFWHVLVTLKYSFNQCYLFKRIFNHKSQPRYLYLTMLSFLLKALTDVPILLESVYLILYEIYAEIYCLII